MNKKHCLFVGHIVYGRNNVYEESLLEKLKAYSASIQIVSVNKTIDLPDREENKSIKVLRAFRKPIVDEMTRFFEFLFFGIQWCRKHKHDDKVLILLSAPVEINLAVVWLQRLFRIKTVNLLIDTALGNILSNRFWDRYLRVCYQRAERLCKNMTASMALNRNVFPFLKLEKKPCLHTRIGHNLQHSNFTYTPTNQKKILVYTGTLTYYDGTKELLQAGSMLNPDEYELHIYGKGPDEAIVRQYVEKFHHIKLKGYLPNSEIREVLANADLLINPRMDNETTDIFGFPSKMIEYLLSGTPVLTTRFAAMPEEYLQFVHLIDQQDGEGIAQAIQRVFQMPENIRRQMCEHAYHFTFRNNSYDQIVKEMMQFFDDI